MHGEFRIGRLLARVGVVLVSQAVGVVVIGLGTTIAAKGLGYDGLDVLTPFFAILGIVELTLVTSIATTAVRAWRAGRRDEGAGWLIGLGLLVLAPSVIYVLSSFGYHGR